MDESEKPDESQNESLAAVPPTPVDKASVALAGNIGLGAIALTVAGAGAIALIAGSMSPTMGATRSTKLEWEQRKLQIEQAEHDAEINSQVDAQHNDQSNPQPDGS
jgi:threonine dehydrogenase-like Zn-dependent dehydrogenase